MPARPNPRLAEAPECLSLKVLFLACALAVSARAALADSTQPPLAVRLTCDAAGNIRIDARNTPSELDLATETPSADQNGDIAALLSGNTADCAAGRHRIRVRASWFDEQWGGWHQRDPAMFVRIWIDQKPLSIVLRLQDSLSARIDVAAKMVIACPTPIDPGRDKKCAKEPFTLGAADPIEFSPQSAFPGSKHDIFITESRDDRLCRAFATYFEGGPPPPNTSQPKSVPAPEAWQGWSSEAYRFDADNDGRIDDVAVLDIEQYVIHGTVVAVFQGDTVLKGKTAVPWWGDLMDLAMGNDHGKIARPPELKAAVWGGPLGLSGNTSIRMHIVDGVTYAQVTPRWFAAYRPMTEDDRKQLSPIEQARSGTQYTEIVVRTLPGMKAQPMCTFSRRSQNFE